MPEGIYFVNKNGCWTIKGIGDVLQGVKRKGDRKLGSDEAMVVLRLDKESSWNLF